MTVGIGFCVLYRARVRPEKEDAYIAAWSRLTLLLRNERGGLGSRLHRGSDGIWYAYAQWPSAQAREDAFRLPALDPSADQAIRDAVIEFFPEILLEPVADHLVCAG